MTLEDERQRIWRIREMLTGGRHNARENQNARVEKSGTHRNQFNHRDTETQRRITPEERMQILLCASVPLW
jgi:hypothetical protein